LKSEHPDTLTSMNNLSFTCESQCCLNDTLDLIQQCVCLRLQVLGPEHFYTKSSNCLNDDTSVS
ncbi:hypothetical protein DL98DRAFT_433745, partial [Cadophora sp. DSE1049]